jgi:hypothetical protein
MTLKWWRPPLAAGHVAAQGGPANGSPAHRSLPLRRFDRTPTTPGDEPLSQAKTHWGFPFLGSPPRKEKRRGEWGKERRSGEGEAAPVTPPVRQDRRPFASTGSRTSRRVEGEPGQSKKWSVAVNTYTVPPSSPSRRRLHRGPNVSRTAALPSLALLPFLGLACEHAFEPPCAAGSP